MPSIKFLREELGKPGTKDLVLGKRVLLRADLNVPLKDGSVAQDARIRAVLPTLELLHARGAAKITLLTHLGRPEGKVVEALRVAPVEKRLRELTAVPFELRENLRFDPREEGPPAGGESFAKELASEADLFVQEAFAGMHRAHASIVAITKLLPSYAGLLVEKEIQNLSQALTPPAGALAVIGGAKFETKVPLIEKLLGVYETICIGGALGNDMLKARGTPVGVSLISSQPVPLVIAGQERVLAPLDVALLNKETSVGRTTNIADVRIQESIEDIGPQTTAAWAARVAAAPFVLWNGPMGRYENGFVEGTEGLARALAGSQARGVVGGGDTIAALSKLGFDETRIFISTGGGAMLEFLAAGTLPGIEALKR